MPEQDMDGPKRKAIKMTTGILANVCQVKEAMNEMIQDKQAGTWVAERDFRMSGELIPIHDSFFANDSPVVELKDSKERIRLASILTDDTGSIPIKLWDSACYTMFKTTATKMRELWETGGEKEEEQVEIPETLNSAMAGKKTSMEQ